MLQGVGGQKMRKENLRITQSLRQAAGMHTVPLDSHSHGHTYGPV